MMAGIRSLRSNILESFQRFDDEGKGWLSQFDVKCAAASLLGYKPSKAELRSIFQDKCPDGSVDKATFLMCMEKRIGVHDPDERIRQIFKMFDCRCAGFISKSDLIEVFANCASHISKQTVSQVYDEIDLDGDGRVSYREFVNMMKFAGRPITTREQD